MQEGEENRSMKKSQVWPLLLVLENPDSRLWLALLHSMLVKIFASNSAFAYIHVEKLSFFTEISSHKHALQVSFFINVGTSFCVIYWLHYQSIHFSFNHLQNHMRYKYVGISNFQNPHSLHLFSHHPQLAIESITVKGQESHFTNQCKAQIRCLLKYDDYPLSVIKLNFSKYRVK